MTDVLAFLNSPPLTVGTRLTAVLFLAYPPWHQAPLELAPGGTVDLLGRIYRLLLVISLVFESPLSSPAFWGLLALIHFGWIAKSYAIADNHRYLEGYWCVALALALLEGGADGQAVIVRNSLLLIGLPFAIAVLRKLLSPTFRDGSFFLRSLIYDPRFSVMAHVLGGLTLDGRGRHIDAIQRVSAGDSDKETIDVPARLRRFARLLTWWTIAIEAFIAITFLTPVVTLQMWQLIPLLIFAVSAYGIVPVQTFSNILLLMLLVSSDSVVVRAVVLATLLLLTLATTVGEKLAQLSRINARRYLEQLMANRDTPVSPHYL